MSIHVRVVTPVTTRDERTYELVRELQSPGVEIDAVEISEGPPAIETEADDARAVPGTVQRIVEAQRDNVDAVVIDCMGDPGLEAARKLVSIPVLGPCQVSFHTAAMMSERFSVVTVQESTCAMLATLASRYGVAERLASVSSIDVPVLELESNPDRVQSLLCEHALRAVRERDAGVIVLGCTGFLGVAEAIGRYLREQNGVHVPVIDPMRLSILTAVTWVRARLTRGCATEL